MAATSLQTVPGDIVKYELMSFLSSHDVTSVAKTCKQMSELKWYHWVAHEWISWLNLTGSEEETTWHNQLKWITSIARRHHEGLVYSFLGKVPAHMLLREIKVEQERKPRWFEELD